MDTETSENKVEIDTNELAMKLSFLVGRTVLLKYADGSSGVTMVHSIRVQTEPEKMVDIYYDGIGMQHITSSKKFNDIMLVNDHGGLTPLGKVTDDLGIVF